MSRINIAISVGTTIVISIAIRIRIITSEAAQPTGSDAAQLAEYPDGAAEARVLLLNNGRGRDDHLHIDAPQLDAGFQDENVGQRQHNKSGPGSLLVWSELTIVG